MSSKPSNRLEYLKYESNLANFTCDDEIVSGTNGIYYNITAKVNALNIIYKGNFKKFIKNVLKRIIEKKELFIF